MAMIIDSSVFITMERRGLSTRVMPIIVAPKEGLAMAAISVSEMLFGAYRDESVERRRRKETFLDAILEAIPVLSIDLRVARAHARLAVDLASAGQKIGANDLLIAATALAWGAAVLTDNLREFERVPGLEVRKPEWPE